MSGSTWHGNIACLLAQRRLGQRLVGALVSVSETPPGDCIPYFWCTVLYSEIAIATSPTHMSTPPAVDNSSSSFLFEIFPFCASAQRFVFSFIIYTVCTIASCRSFPPTTFLHWLLTLTSTISIPHLELLSSAFVQPTFLIGAAFILATALTVSSPNSSVRV